ncbi:hypothetical protein [Alistipes sp.]|uniref:hypothetical protein n=1 Tax=Alistipes sp. TaxID=1872444 RepID=UPI003AF04562
MNKKTFTLALLFLIVTLGWLGVNIYWDCTGNAHIFDTFLAVLFVLFAAAMVHNEFHKKRCRHLDEVNKHKIP